VWQSDGDGGVWYNGGWVQQGYSSLDNYYITRENTSKFHYSFIRNFQ